MTMHKMDSVASNEYNNYACSVTRVAILLCTFTTQTHWCTCSHKLYVIV